MVIDDISFLGSDAKRFKTDQDTQTHQSSQVITSKLNLMLNMHTSFKNDRLRCFFTLCQMIRYFVLNDPVIIINNNNNWTGYP